MLIITSHKLPNVCEHKLHYPLKLLIKAMFLLCTESSQPCWSHLHASAPGLLFSNIAGVKVDNTTEKVVSILL